MSDEPGEHADRTELGLDITAVLNGCVASAELLHLLTGSTTTAAIIAALAVVPAVVVMRGKNQNG